MARLRGYENAIESAQYVMGLWNSVVVKEDTVWVLGDFVMCEWALQYVEMLAGHIQLIRGNHDSQRVLDVLNKHPKIYVHGWVHQIGSLVLTHEPVAQRVGLVNIHGHTHGRGVGDVGIWTWGRLITIQEVLRWATSC